MPESVHINCDDVDRVFPGGCCGGCHLSLDPGDEFSLPVRRTMRIDGQVIELHGCCDREARMKNITDAELRMVLKAKEAANA